MLSQKDGPRWREKVHLPKFSPFEVPDIIGLDGKSTSQPVYTPLQTSSQSQPTCTNMNQSQSTCNNQSKESINESTSSPSKETEKITPVIQQESKKVPESKILSPQEQFDAYKLEGNEHVKQVSYICIFISSNFFKIASLNYYLYKGFLDLKRFETSKILFSTVSISHLYGPVVSS